MDGTGKGRQPSRVIAGPGAAADGRLTMGLAGNVSVHPANGKRRERLVRPQV
jgi:hypothetical protein